MAPAESQEAIKEFGRPEYAKRIAEAIRWRLPLDAGQAWSIAFRMLGRTDRRRRRRRDDDEYG